MVLVICSVDPVERERAAGALLLDLPEAVVVRYDVEAGLLRRHVHDWGGTREIVAFEPEDECLTCAVRADLNDVAGHRPVIAALPAGVEAGHLGLPGPVVAAVSPETLRADLFGDDLLAERGLAASSSDRRSVGEILATHIENADVVSVSDVPAPADASLLAHLTEAPVAHALEAGALKVRPKRDRVLARPTGAPDDEHTWTLHLRSPHPFHPDRLHESIEALGTGPIRGRGAFWLPTRPATLALWDGAGGQLSIGSVGRWPDQRRHTNLVITGVGPEKSLIEQTFERALLTPAELSRGPRWWSTQDDGFAPYL